MVDVQLINIISNAPGRADVHRQIVGGDLRVAGCWVSKNVVKDETADPLIKLRSIQQVK